MVEVRVPYPRGTLSQDPNREPTRHAPPLAYPQASTAGLWAEGDPALHGSRLASGECGLLALAGIDGLLGVVAAPAEEPGDLEVDGADDLGDVLVAELGGGEEGDRVAGLVRALVDPIQEQRVEVHVEPQRAVKALREHDGTWEGLGLRALAPRPATPAERAEHRVDEDAAAATVAPRDS